MTCRSDANALTYCATLARHQNCERKDEVIFNLIDHFERKYMCMDETIWKCLTFPYITTQFVHI